MKNKVEAALFIFLSVGEGDHAAYNRYSSYDHMPEFQILRSQVHCQRYVSTPELRASRTNTDPALAPSQYLIGYYHTGPAEETLKERAEHNDWIVANAPVFEGNRTLQSIGAFDFVKGHVAPRLPISPEAVLYRPHTGIYVTMSDVNSPRDSEPLERWYEQVHFPEMLSLKGFAGVWRFVSRHHPDFPVPPGRFLHIYFLDEEPSEALSTMRARMPDGFTPGRGPETQFGPALIESAFRTIVDTMDAKYDWFEK